jgi:hypothetical protein
MSLTHCPECQTTISNKAKICPACGVRPPRRTSKLVLILVGALCISLTIALTTGPTNTLAEAQAQSLAKTISDKAESDRFDMARESARAVRAAMRDPASFEVEFIGVSSDAKISCMKYRSRNGFGGMNGGIAVTVGSKVHDKASLWTKHCKQPLHDLTYASK